MGTHPTTLSTNVRYSNEVVRPESVCSDSICRSLYTPDLSHLVPSFSVHPDELQESTKKKLNDRGYFYANSNAGLGWTNRANR